MSNSAELGPEVTGSLGYLLKHAHLELDALTTRSLEPFGIDPRALGVLRLLSGREATSQQEVAQLLGVDRTTMVALLDSLEAKGIVSRRPLVEDRRRNVIEVTSAGADVFAEAQAAAKAAEESFLASQPAADANHFTRTLHRLVTGRELTETG